MWRSIIHLTSSPIILLSFLNPTTLTLNTPDVCLANSLFSFKYVPRSHLLNEIRPNDPT